MQRVRKRIIHSGGVQRRKEGAQPDPADPALAEGAWRSFGDGSTGSKGGDEIWWFDPSLATVTPEYLAELEARLGPLARDVAGTRRRLSPAHWAARLHGGAD